MKKKEFVDGIVRASHRLKGQVIEDVSRSSDGSIDLKFEEGSFLRLPLLGSVRYYSKGEDNKLRSELLIRSKAEKHQLAFVAAVGIACALVVILVLMLFSGSITVW